MSSSNRRREQSPLRGGVASSKLRMDRQPLVTRISDPSLTIGRRKEIDNVMKKARANTNDYWDKKLLEVEEKDPNRWRHTGYKKMYIEGESSSESDRESFRFNRNRNSRSRSRNRKSPPMSPAVRKRTPIDIERRRSPPSPMQRGGGGISSRRTPELKRPRSPEMRRRPRSPPEPPLRRKPSPRSLIDARKHTPASPIRRIGSGGVAPLGKSSLSSSTRPGILPRSKRPPSPPPKVARTPSNSSVSSCSDDSCSVCSPKIRRVRSRSVSNSRVRHAPLSPSPHAAKVNGRNGPSYSSSMMPIAGHHTKQRPVYHAPESSSRSNRPPSPISHGRNEEKQRMHSSKSHRIEDKLPHPLNSDKIASRDRILASRSHVIVEPTSLHHDASSVKHALSRSSKNSNRVPSSHDYIRSKNPPEPPEPAPIPKKKTKDKAVEKLRAKVKIEGEKRKHKDKEKEREKESSESDESSSSESSFPTFAATTRLTLSERFGKMAQWSVDRSNMENMRITKDSAGGALKVMIEEGLESPPRRYSYSPAPQGHFPEELATTAPTGLMSWDDVRVRYEYYKSRGYLRDLDLKDYVKWEEWWYRYQEWLKQERYYEFYERQQMNRRRRKKVPITQRLN